jgi:hypothetical protein
VAQAADREQLGGALHHSDNDGLQHVHARFLADAARVGNPTQVLVIGRGDGADWQRLNPSHGRFACPITRMATPTVTRRDPGMAITTTIMRRRAMTWLSLSAPC